MPRLLILLLVFGFVAQIHASEEADCDEVNYVCADKSELCPEMEHLCENFFFRSCMRNACPRTCRVCNGEVTVPVTMATATNSVETENTTLAWTTVVPKNITEIVSLESLTSTMSTSGISVEESSSSSSPSTSAEMNGTSTASIPSTDWNGEVNGSTTERVESSSTALEELSTTTESIASSSTTLEELSTTTESIASSSTTMVELTSITTVTDEETSQMPEANEQPVILGDRPAHFRSLEEMYASNEKAGENEGSTGEESGNRQNGTLTNEDGDINFENTKEDGGKAFEWEEEKHVDSDDLVKQDDDAVEGIRGKHESSAKSSEMERMENGTTMEGSWEWTENGDEAADQKRNEGNIKWEEESGDGNVGSFKKNSESDGQSGGGFKWKKEEWRGGNDEGGKGAFEFGASGSGSRESRKWSREWHEGGEGNGGGDDGWKTDLQGDSEGNGWSQHWSNEWKEGGDGDGGGGFEWEEKKSEVGSGGQAEEVNDGGTLEKEAAVESSDADFKESSREDKNFNESFKSSSEKEVNANSLNEENGEGGGIGEEQIQVEEGKADNPQQGSDIGITETEDAKDNHSGNAVIDEENDKEKKPEGGQKVVLAGDSGQNSAQICQILCRHRQLRAGRTGKRKEFQEIADPALADCNCDGDSKRIQW